MELIITEQDKYTRLFRQAVDKWGIEPNLDKVIEEAAEVIQAIAKWKTFGDEASFEHLHEEMADLQICMDLMYETFLSNNDVKEWYRKKMDRMERRIESSNLHGK